MNKIKVFDEIALDAGVTKILSPSSSSCLTDAVVSVELSNLANDAISNFDVTYVVKQNDIQIDTNIYLGKLHVISCCRPWSHFWPSVLISGQCCVAP